jgi:hypothetical protein
MSHHVAMLFAAHALRVERHHPLFPRAGGRSLHRHRPDAIEHHFARLVAFRFAPGGRLASRAFGGAPNCLCQTPSPPRARAFCPLARTWASLGRARTAWDSTRVRRSCARCLWGAPPLGGGTSGSAASRRAGSLRAAFRSGFGSTTFGSAARCHTRAAGPCTACARLRRGFLCWHIERCTVRTDAASDIHPFSCPANQLPCQPPTANRLPATARRVNCRPLTDVSRTTDDALRGDMQSATCSRRRAVAGGAAVARVRQRLVGERGAARRDCPADCFRWRVGGWRIAVLVGRGCAAHAVGATHPTCALASVSSPRPTHLKNTTVITA